MGTIKGNYEEASIEPQTLLYGNNEFETGTLTVAAPEKDGALEPIGDGAVLVRGSDGNYTPATSAVSDEALVVLVDRVDTPITAAGTYPVRVCISGKVNRNLLKVAGQAVTDSQVNLLRSFGILALPTREA